MTIQLTLDIFWQSAAKLFHQAAEADNPLSLNNLVCDDSFICDMTDSFYWMTWLISLHDSFICDMTDCTYWMTLLISLHDSFISDMTNSFYWMTLLISLHDSFICDMTDSFYWMTLLISLHDSLVCDMTIQFTEWHYSFLGMSRSFAIRLKT